MRYIEKFKPHEDYSFSNHIAQRIKLDQIFGELHNLPFDKFTELYVERKIQDVNNIELLADITKINISAWRGFTGRIGKRIDLVEELNRNIEAEEYTVLQLMSPIGSGKTTYLHHFLKVDLVELLNGIVEIVPIIFDFRTHNVTNENMSKILYEFIDNEINKNFNCFGDPKNEKDFHATTHKIDLEILARDLIKEGVGTNHHKLNTNQYAKQRQIIRSEMKANPLSYLNIKVRYVKDKYPKAKLIVAIDNIDQFASLNTGLAITLLNQMAENFKIDCIITLRDTTFRLFQAFDPSGAWHRPKPIILTPTTVEDIGLKRIDHLCEQIKDVLGEKSIYFKFLRHLIYQFQHVPKKRKSYYFNVLWEWMDSLGNHNIREILDLLKFVMRSYHLTEKEFEKTKTNQFLKYNGKRNINIKRVKTALINGFKSNYLEQHSGTPVLNLFDEGDNEFEYHYIFRLKILQYLGNQKVYTIKEMRKRLTNILGEQLLNHIKNTLSLFINKGLIAVEFLTEYEYKTIYGGGFLIDDSRISNSQAFLAPNGKFHLDVLIFDDIYLDEMKYSTDFCARDYDIIFRNQSQNEPDHRIYSTRRFIEVLTKAEQISESFFSKLKLQAVFDEIARKYENDKWKEGYFRDPKSI